MLEDNVREPYNLKILFCEKYWLIKTGWLVTLAHIIVWQVIRVESTYTVSPVVANECASKITVSLGVGLCI